MFVIDFTILDAKGSCRARGGRSLKNIEAGALCES